MSNRPNEDLRLSATKTVWFGAVAMLGTCIPLVALLGKGAGIIPVAVIIGASIVTTRIWKSTPSSFPTQGNLPSSLPQGEAQRLAQRLANLETIVTREDWDLQERIKRLENKP
jgi:hypothetical protein